MGIDPEKVGYLRKMAQWMGFPVGEANLNFLGDSFNDLKKTSNGTGNGCRMNQARLLLKKLEFKAFISPNMIIPFALDVLSI